MQPPLFVRPVTDAERAALEDGLHSSDAFVLCRCQVLLASTRGERLPAIARALGCDAQTARNAIHAFNARGLAALTPVSSRPRTSHAAFDAVGVARLPDLLHRSPREFGHPTSLWTLELVAEVSFAEGVTATRVSCEAIRATLARLGVRWQWAKTWIASPDPTYARKKASATA